VVYHGKNLVAMFLVFLALWLSASLTFAQDVTQTAPGGPVVTTPGAPALPVPAASAPQPKIDKGDTAWMLTSAALVLMMTIPGLFLFYGGLVRRKNVLGTIMH